MANPLGADAMAAPASGVVADWPAQTIAPLGPFC
jgi:hypothetical protein